MVFDVVKVFVLKGLKVLWVELFLMMKIWFVWWGCDDIVIDDSYIVEV